jgi:hypothetical protein
MARTFYWRRRTASWFKIAFFSLVSILVSAIVLIAWYVHSGTIFPKWLGLVVLNGLVVTAYLSPRFIGLLRNRMRIICDETGLELPSGRRLPREHLRNLNLAVTGGRPPVIVVVAHWPLPARIYLSCYEDGDGLLRCLRGYGQQVAERTDAGR